MDSRERVLRVLKHEEADRVPFIDFAWGETLESPSARSCSNEKLKLTTSSETTTTRQKYEESHDTHL